jgi:hypothetical protein
MSVYIESSTYNAMEGMINNTGRASRSQVIKTQCLGQTSCRVPVITKLSAHSGKCAICLGKRKITHHCAGIGDMGPECALRIQAYKNVARAYLTGKGISSAVEAMYEAYDTRAYRQDESDSEDEFVPKVVRKLGKNYRYRPY